MLTHREENGSEESEQISKSSWAASAMVQDRGDGDARQGGCRWQRTRWRTGLGGISEVKVTRLGDRLDFER